MKPEEKFFDWFKHNTNEEWTFGLTFQHKAATDTFIYRWMQGKNNIWNGNNSTSVPKMLITTKHKNVRCNNKP